MSCAGLMLACMVTLHGSWATDMLHGRLLCLQVVLVLAHRDAVENVVIKK
jgi:hypothetical protein